MAQVVVVADDLTGALDSGVCLLPAEVGVAVSPEGFDAARIAASGDVLSVNAQSRHLSPEGAAARVGSLVSSAYEAGATCVVKKTDSALRGNVGAELAAALEASGRPRLHFLPALPRMGRLTQGGVQTIGGVPVAESAFGRDPFEPVTRSRVDEIVAAQTSVPVRLVAEGEAVPVDFEGIVAYDVTSEASMLSRVRELAGLGELGLVAGCAGVTEALARVLCLPASSRAALPDAGHLLVVCGSVNPVSQVQCRFAEARGVPTFHLGAREKVDPAWADSAEGRAFVGRVRESWKEAPLTLVDASAREDLAALAPAGADVRQLVADDIARVAIRACEGGAYGRMLVMGGDVLSSFLLGAGVSEVRPLGELAPGIVGFSLVRGGRTMVVVSKSGGFGVKELFVRLAQGPAR